MLVDRLAYGSSWRFIHPGEKLVLFLVLSFWGFLPFWWIRLGLLLVFPVLFFWSGVAFPLFGRLLLVPFLFLFSGVLVVMFSSQGNWWEGIQLALRSMVMVSSFLLLTSTTPIPDLLGFLRRFRSFKVFADIALLTYRYLFVFSERAEKVYCAQQARLGYGSFRRGLTALAMLVGGLLLYSLRTMEVLRLALEARGFGGELVVLPPAFRPLRTRRVVLLLGISVGGGLITLFGRHCL